MKFIKGGNLRFDGAKRCRGCPLLEVKIGSHPTMAGDGQCEVKFLFPNEGLKLLLRKNVLQEFFDFLRSKLCLLRCIQLTVNAQDRRCANTYMQVTRFANKQ